VKDPNPTTAQPSVPGFSPRHPPYGGRPLDVAIDGADSVDRSLNLVKGGGGAHFREKLVELASNKFVCIVDEGKLCSGLGKHFPLPVEIVPFCHEHTMRKVAALPGLTGATMALRLGDSANNKPEPGQPPALTDNGNYIIDVTFPEEIKDAKDLAFQLDSCHGVVDHGLFIGMADQIIVAGKDGGIRVAGEGGEDKVWW